MKSTAPLVCILIGVCLPSISTATNCGGLLDDITGELQFSGSRLPAAAAKAPQTCIWILKTRSEFINFTLEKLAGPSSLIVHHNQDGRLNFRPVKFDSRDVGSSVTLSGEAVLVIVGGVTSETEFSFSWDSEDLQVSRAPISTSAYYLNDGVGQLSLRRWTKPRKLLWTVNSDEIGLEIQGDFSGNSCDVVSVRDSCECNAVVLFEVLRNGKLREFTRQCDTLPKYRRDRIDHPVIILGFINGTNTREDSGDYLELTWGYPATASSVIHQPVYSPVPSESGGTNETSSSENASVEYEEPGEGCGGRVLILAEGTTELEYKMAESYGNLERCVWTLEGSSRLHVINIHVDYQGFEDDGDGLTFYYVDEKSKNFKGIKIHQSDTGSNLTFHARQALLFFSSDGSGTSRGFRLLLSSLQFGVARGDESVVSFTAPHGFYFYPEIPGEYYDGDERLAVVIHPHSGSTSSGSSNHLRRLLLPFTVTLSFLDVADDDFLHIYTLLPYNDSSRLLLNGRYSGFFPNGIENATTSSSEPRLLFFTSNGYSSGRGFQLLWYPSALIK